MCVVKLSAAGTKADLAVFATETEAKSMRDHISSKGDAAGGPAPLKISINCGQSKVDTMVKDSSLLHATRLSLHVGKKIKGIMLPIYVGGLFHSMQKVDAEVVESAHHCVRRSSAPAVESPRRSVIVRTGRVSGRVSADCGSVSLGLHCGTDSGKLA